MSKNKITAEEKEILRSLMEDNNVCRQWDFFDEFNWKTPPPPEYFMRGKPERPNGWKIYTITGVVLITLGIIKRLRRLR